MPDVLRDTVGAALSQALAGQSEMVTRWVALVEVMDEDGERAAYVLAHDGAKPWDVLGMCAFAMQMQQADSCCAAQDDD